jgi:hypothetical protein
VHQHHTVLAAHIQKKQNTGELKLLMQWAVECPSFAHSFPYPLSIYTI